VHRSQSVQVTPGEQETTNQKELGEEKINKRYLDNVMGRNGQ